MEVDTCTFVNVLLLIFVIDIPGRRVKNDKCAQSSKVFSASGNMDQWASPGQPSPSDTVTWRSQRALLTFTFHMSLNTILERHLVIASLLKR